MRKLLLASALALSALASPASADILFGTFTLEYFDPTKLPGPGPFGTVTISGTTADALVQVNVGDNWLIDTGGPHQPFAFNLLGTDPNPAPGDQRVTDVQLATLFNAGGSNRASPFGTFTNTIVSLDPPLGCSQGGSDNGCGVHDLSFHVLGYTGMFANSWNGNDVYFAADILQVPCEGNCTGNVGGGHIDPVPGPIVGAGIPGIIAACSMMLGLGKYRRRRNGATLPA